MTKSSNEHDSDSEYELAKDHFEDDTIDKVISAAFGQEPVSDTTSQAPVDTQDASEKPDLPEKQDLAKDNAENTEPPYTEEELVEIKKQALSLKEDGNSLYKSGDENAAMVAYSEGIEMCKTQLDDLRSILHANRAACHVNKLEFKEAEEDCTVSISLAPQYCKAILRRAQVREKLDKLSQALEDYKTVLELDPRQGTAIEASRRLPAAIHEQQEKMKEECMGKLKDLGNLVLKPFGLSTENFKMVQDPATGGYNMSFSQEK